MYSKDLKGRELSNQMLQAKDDAEYADLWKDFIMAYNEELLLVPLYQNTYVDFMSYGIQSLEPNSYWPFEKAVLYATIKP